MTDTDRLPPERRLPPPRRDQILRSVLDGEEPSMSNRVRVRWFMPIAIGAAAALIAVGAVALSDRDGALPGEEPPPASQPADETVPLDLGPLTEAEMEEVLRHDFDPDSPGYTFHYTRRIDGPVEPIPVIVATPPGIDEQFAKTGNLVGMYDGPAPTPTHPIQEADPDLDLNDNPDFGSPSTDMADDIYKGTGAYWKIAGLYRVADTVGRIEVRVATPNGSEPWRVADPHGGYVFWATWFEIAEYEPGTELTVEWRAYDTAGDPIAAELLPDQPRTVTIPESLAPNSRSSGPYVAAPASR
jgi:hypothetical protein